MLDPSEVIAIYSVGILQEFVNGTAQQQRGAEGGKLTFSVRAGCTNRPI